VRPEKIRVFLQQSSDYDEEDPQKATWRYYNLETEETTEKNPDDSYYIELDKSNNWTKGIKGLPLLSGEEDSASSYYYRITGEQMYVDGQWVDINRSDGNSYQAKYGDPVKPEETAVLNVTNTLEKGSVKILKQDSETSSLLKGASFKLERLVEETDNTDIEKWKVDESWKAKTGDTDGFGELVFKDLPYGSYKITEVKSPTGYVLLRKPIYVTINEEEFDKQAQEHQGDDSFDASLKTILVTVKNDKGLTVPGTGAGGTFMLTMAGLALMLGGAMLLYMRRVRSIRQSSRHSAENK
ncbi:MAG: SpaA isopeptide-forming pilin-related protein, partial [Blautia sp.]